jgi:hypothetical protein
MSRKEKYARKPLVTKTIIKNYSFAFTSAIWLVFIITAFQSSIIPGVICFFMLSPLIGWRISKQNILSIFLFYFGIYPIAVACWILLLISFLHSYYQMPINNSIASILLLSVVPIYSLIMILIKRNQKEFLHHTRKSLELLNALSLTITGISALYAYMHSDFTFIAPYIDLKKLPELGFQIRDAFNYICLFLSFPFVVSGAFCKFTVEILLDSNILIK